MVNLVYLNPPYPYKNITKLLLKDVQVGLVLGDNQADKQTNIFDNTKSDMYNVFEEV